MLKSAKRLLLFAAAALAMACTVSVPQAHAVEPTARAYHAASTPALAPVQVEASTSAERQALEALAVRWDLMRPMIELRDQRAEAPHRPVGHLADAYS